MDNNAFKDLVRTHNQPGSSKAIARKAVEEEFLKKKKRTRGGGYNDSDDEDEGGKTSFGGKKRNKGGKADNNYYGNGKQHEQKDDDNAKAIEEDLSSRYRDRAKERREGGTLGTGTAPASSASDAFLIIPHNKRGLDIALARKDRQVVGLSKLVGIEKSMATTSTENINSTVDDDEVPNNDCKIRKELPSLNEAKLILQDFVSSKNNSIDDSINTSINNIKDSNNLDDDYRSIIVSSGMVEYINGILKLKTSDINSFSFSPLDNNATASSSDNTAADENTCSMAGKTLQRTMYSLAIDGHPSDYTRAWEVPRQYTLSRVGGGGSSSSSKSPTLLSKDVMNKIDLVFKSRNIIRDEMMKEQVGRTRCIQSTTTTRKGEVSHVKDTTNKGNNNNDSDDDDDDDDDDDIFGGLDD